MIHIGVLALATHSRQQIRFAVRHTVTHPAATRRRRQPTRSTVRRHNHSGLGGRCHTRLSARQHTPRRPSTTLLTSHHRHSSSHRRSEPRTVAPSHTARMAVGQWAAGLRGGVSALLVVLFALFTLFAFEEELFLTVGFELACENVLAVRLHEVVHVGVGAGGAAAGAADEETAVAAVKQTLAGHCQKGSTQRWKQTGEYDSVGRAERRWVVLCVLCCATAGVLRLCIDECGGQQRLLSLVCQHRLLCPTIIHRRLLHGRHAGESGCGSVKCVQYAARSVRQTTGHGCAGCVERCSGPLRNSTRG